MSVAFTARIDAQFTSGVWTSLGRDVLGQVQASLGIQGNGPTDVVAGTGELHFDLDNSAQNLGTQQSWYSPASASVRSGWNYGTIVRLVITYAATDYVRFIGKVAVIQPDPGIRGSRRVHVVAYDYMADLIDAVVNTLTIQIGQTEDALINAVLATLPTTAQPPATSLSAGLDTYATAFDQVGSGSPAASIMKDVVVSSLGALFIDGGGTLRYKTRRQRASLVSSLAFSSDMVGLVVPSSLANVYNRVRATTHPKTTDATATTVLWSQTGTGPLIPHGTSLTIWGVYHDPTNTLKLIGGTAIVAVTANTDYTANTASDGSGTDETANFSIVATSYATQTQFVITNNGPDAYLTKLQVRGKGIYDNGPQTFETYVAMAYGDRPIDIDMKYQSQAILGQSVSAFVCAQYDNPGAFVDQVDFVASSTPTFMLAALTLDPATMITITETLTGLAAKTAIIQSVQLTITLGNELRCTYKLAPAAPYAMWQIGVAGHSELGNTTILGF